VEFNNAQNVRLLGAKVESGGKVGRGALLWIVNSSNILVTATNHHTGYGVNGHLLVQDSNNIVIGPAYNYLHYWWVTSQWQIKEINDGVTASFSPDQTKQVSLYRKGFFDDSMFNSALPSSCGNGTIEAGEQCDNGVNNGICPKTCSAACVTNNCGDSTPPAKPSNLSVR
jgi:hypothetical protein